MQSEHGGSVSEAMYLIRKVTDLDVNIADKHGYTLYFATWSLAAVCTITLGLH